MKLRRIRPFLEGSFADDCKRFDSGKNHYLNHYLRSEFPDTHFGQCSQMLNTDEFGAPGQWTNIPCDTKLPYVCMKAREQISFFSRDILSESALPWMNVREGILIAHHLMCKKLQSRKLLYCVHNVANECFSRCLSHVRTSRLPAHAVLRGPGNRKYTVH